MEKGYFCIFLITITTCFLRTGKLMMQLDGFPYIDNILHLTLTVPSGGSCKNQAIDQNSCSPANLILKRLKNIFFNCVT